MCGVYKYLPRIFKFEHCMTCVSIFYTQYQKLTRVILVRTPQATPVGTPTLTPKNTPKKDPSSKSQLDHKQIPWIPIESSRILYVER